MRNSSSVLLTVCFALFLVALVGCGTAKSPQYFVLESAHQPLSDETREALVSIGFWKPEIPEYLEHAGVVTRRSVTEISVAEQAQWAQPLADSLTAVMIANMEHACPGLVVETPPRYSRRLFDLKVKVRRFERLEDSVTLEAEVRRTPTLREPFGPAQIVRIDSPCGGISSAATVQCMSAAANEFSRRVITLFSNQISCP